MFNVKETSPGVFELDWKFKLKSSYAALKEFNAVNEFCFRVRDRMNNLVKKHERDKIFQSLSNQEKKELDVVVKN